MQSKTIDKPMKKLTFCLALCLMLLASCRHDNKEFKTHTLSGEKCWLQIFDEPYVFGLDTIGVKVTYTLQWPDKGVISPAAERELMFLCFGDSNKVNVESAIQGWIVEDVNDLQPVESINEEPGYSYLDIKGTCQKDSTLATFIIQTEGFPLGAAHGMHSTDFLTVDLETGNAIHLVDLVTDTNLLCEAIAHAVQDLEVNKDVRECLFDEFRDVERMPVPHNFTIDSARNGIIVYYGLYEIACYACGIQEVVLPIFWLSKYVPLTPYAKRLFGPGCSIE